MVVFYLMLTIKPLKIVKDYLMNQQKILTSTSSTICKLKHNKLDLVLKIVV
jgi:hypothetical protein